MLQLPLKMRRELSGLAQNQELKELLRMLDRDLNQALDEKARDLRARGYRRRVIEAYQEVGPLLLEKQAVAQYRARVGSEEVERALPEVDDVPEALYLASHEWGLDSEEQGQLRQLLEQDLSGQET